MERGWRTHTWNNDFFFVLQVIVFVCLFIYFVMYLMYTSYNYWIIYLLIYVDVFLFMFYCVFKLFSFYCRAWCRHPHMSTCVGGWNRWLSNAHMGGVGKHRNSLFRYEHGIRAFIMCLCICSFSPFLGPWRASAWDLGVFRICKKFCSSCWG